MLAYVFWHQRNRAVAREEDQARLAEFHRALQAQRPPGFHFSLVLEMARLPWMAEGSEAYEDWYILENSAALDPLDTAAVTGACREPHNQAARLAEHGTGGLYRLKIEKIDTTHLAAIRYTNWFSKPAGMSYDSLYNLLHQSQIERQGTLWQRQMTMGPALEFCLHSSQKIAEMEEIKSVQVEVQPIFVPG